MARSCGDCQLCCKLLPVRELQKGANTRCRHQRHGKGCQVYNQPAMPFSCKAWNCRWVLEDRTEDMRRPDRVGYVIDVMPDFVTMRNDLSGEIMHIPVLQVWVDPTRPDAWRNDPDFKPYLARLGVEEGLCALIRNGSTKSVFVAPPSINADHTWFETGTGISGPEHRPEDMQRAGFDVKLQFGER